MTTMTRVSMKERVATPIMLERTNSCFSGNDTIKLYGTGPDLSYKNGIEYFGPV